MTTRNDGPCFAAAPRLLRTAGSCGLALLVALSSACAKPGEPEIHPPPPTPTYPMFEGPVSPLAVHWGTRGAQFVISGGRDVQGRSFTARLGDAMCFPTDHDCWAFDCQSATLDAADPTKLNVLCDIPEGGPRYSLFFTVMSDDAWAFGWQWDQQIVVDWPPATGPASLEAASTSSMTWGMKDSLLVVDGGVNLPGHALTAKLDGVACKQPYVSSMDSGRLVTYCSPRPGNAPGTATLLVQEDGVTIPGGELAIDVGPCRDPGPAADGVPLPLLCNAPPGSIAMTSAGLEGIWGRTGSSQVPSFYELFASNGEFMTRWPAGGEWTASGSTWTPSNAESWEWDHAVPMATTSRAYVPFGGGLAGVVYLPANALLVSQAGVPGTVSVAGTWGTSDAPLALTADTTGAFTGTTSGSDGVCTLTGTISVIEPPKNMLAVSLLAAGGSDCKLFQSGTLTGLGYIDPKVVAPWPSSPFAMEYTLRLLVRSPGQSYAYEWATRPLATGGTTAGSPAAADAPRAVWSLEGGM